MMTRKVIVLLDNVYTGDPRVEKEVKTLVQQGYDIDLYCLQGEGLAEKESKDGIQIQRLFDLRIFDVKETRYVDEISKKILNGYIDKKQLQLIHCHDHTMLNLGRKIHAQLSDVKLIYDSHELFFSYPIMNIPPIRDPWLYVKSKIVRSVQLYRERKNIKHADAVITVNDSLADLIQKRFHLKIRPVVLRNAPRKTKVNPDKSYFRALFGIDAQQKILVFITAHIHETGSNLKWAITGTGKVKEMALVIIGQGKGKKYFENYCSANHIDNVFFHEPVPPNKIIHYLSCADFGLVPF